MKTKLLISTCVLLSVFVMGAAIGAGCAPYKPTSGPRIAPPPEITNTPDLVFYVSEEEFTCRAVPVWKLDEGNVKKLLVLDSSGSETVLYVTDFVFSSVEVGHVYEFVGPVGQNPVVDDFVPLEYTAEWNSRVMAYIESQKP